MPALPSPPLTEPIADIPQPGTPDFEFHRAQLSGLLTRAWLNWFRDLFAAVTGAQQGSGLALVEVGSIVMTGRATAPTGYLLCDGAAVSRSVYARLFTAIGTTWGAGDGSTTFNVPDLRNVSPMGAGSTVALAASAGALAASHTHEFTLQNHTHGPGTLATGNPDFPGTEVQSGTGAFVAAETHFHSTALDSWSGTTDSPSDNTGTTDPAAGSVLHPVRGVQFIIKT